ncbi:MAG: hypothetical protein ABIN61_08465 [candidate division WOR-3 bacterium]
MLKLITQIKAGNSNIKIGQKIPTFSGPRQLSSIKTVSKLIILIFLLQFGSVGCIPSSKYLVSKEPVIINKEEIGSWIELEGKIIDINSENIIINLKERKYKNIKEKIRYRLKYKYGFRKRKEQK